MPYQIWSEGSILRGAFTGVVTSIDMIKLLKSVNELERGLNPMPDRMMDLSAAVDFELRFSELFSFAQQRMTTQFPNTIKSALVAPQPVQMGFARMYQTLLNHPQIDLQIFQDVPTGLAWLGVPIEAQSRAS